MKKLALLLAIALFASCSDDEDGIETCTIKLWELAENCSQTDPTNCTYVATFGETEADAGTIFVDESTFNHYTNEGNPNNGSLCWDGTH